MSPHLCPGAYIQVLTLTSISLCPRVPVLASPSLSPSPHAPVPRPCVPVSPRPRRSPPPAPQEHNFIKRYETLEVDVASWFKDVMAKTESPRTGGGLSQHHLPFFTR